MSAESSQDVFAFQCWRKQSGEEFSSIVNAETAGKARYRFMLEIGDVYPDISITDIRVRKYGAAHSSRDFIRCATYRGIPELRCGDRVKCGDSEGSVVGHGGSANFEVSFHTGKYAGAVLYCHPSELTPVSPAGGSR